MKKLLALLVIVIVIWLFGLSGTEQPVTPRDNGTLEIYFCPREDCKGEFIGAIASANESLDCALYDPEDDDMLTVLQNKSKHGVQTRLVYDDDYQKELALLESDSANSISRHDTRGGLMHNKFCIIDSHYVTTGSMNPTYNDFYKNANNFLRIDSTAIARLYTAEFEELWNGTFRRGKPNSFSTVVVNNTAVSVHFCPDDSCEDAVVKQILSANASVRFLTFSLTSDRIASALILVNKTNVTVQGVMEKRQISQYSVFETLRDAHISVAVSNQTGQLHDKIFIVDDSVVLTGSYNPTKNGDSGNDENLLIIYDSMIAAEYILEFNRIWNSTHGADAITSS
ncbi:MAG TPA: phospholipase D-like domain-containing protein [Acidobacteriota bacterium]|nr:phospholipase D-like domain-containing protein [Acidobacteriota bacterium]